MNKATVLSPYAASLALRRTGLNFIFSANRGCAATPLHPCLRADAPYRGLKFGFAYGSQSPLQIPIYRAAGDSCLIGCSSAHISVSMTQLRLAEGSL